MSRDDLIRIDEYHDEKSIKKLLAEHLQQADAIRKLADYARQTMEFSIEYNMKNSKKSHRSDPAPT